MHAFVYFFSRFCVFMYLRVLAWVYSFIWVRMKAVWLFIFMYIHVCVYLCERACVCLIIFFFLCEKNKSLMRPFSFQNHNAGIITKYIANVAYNSVYISHSIFLYYLVFISPAIFTYLTLLFSLFQPSFFFSFRHFSSSCDLPFPLFWFSLSLSC